MCLLAFRYQVSFPMADSIIAMYDQEETAGL